MLKNGKYIYQTVPHVTFPDFFNTFTDNRSLVPILIMDAEGGEWSVLPYIGHYGVGANFKVEFCQVNFEFHFGSVEEVQKYYGEFFIKSPFLPLWMFRLTFTRGFMINIENDQCYQLFYSNLC